jgi:hypothetical protein
LLLETRNLEARWEQYNSRSSLLQAIAWLA